IGTVKTTSTNRANEFVVATNAEFAPFEYMMGESFGGIDMQVAKVIADKLGKELVIVHMDFEAVIPAVEAGNADVGMAGLTISDERKETVDFSDSYYKTTQYIAVGINDNRFDECKTEEDVVNVLADLPNNTKAGAARAQTGFYYLTGDEGLEFEGFSNLSTTPYASIALAVQDLANGKVELVCGDKDTLTAAVKAVNR
ncbi:MAG: transporter substrate-binding domain-containing protein, partial [Clostridiales bacterium]|nr:transporter substrate-binding domain-containing protein [Clostridiales bacterium]